MKVGKHSIVKFVIIQIRMTSTNKMFCCSGVLLDSATDNLDGANCLAVWYHVVAERVSIINHKTGVPGLLFAVADLSEFSTELMGETNAARSTNGDKQSSPASSPSSAENVQRPSPLFYLYLSIFPPSFLPPSLFLHSPLPLSRSASLASLCGRGITPPSCPSRLSRLRRQQLSGCWTC